MLESSPTWVGMCASVIAKRVSLWAHNVGTRMLGVPADFGKVSKTMRKPIA